MKLNRTKVNGCSISSMMKTLGRIDKRVELKKLTPKQHDKETRKALTKCLTGR